MPVFSLYILNAHCPLPISSHPSRTHSTLHTPLMHSHYSFPPNPFFSHSCMATHGHVMPISPYANLHTRILHALMYITALPCITILHLPIFLLLTTFLSLHHHHYQTLIFSLTNSLSTPYPVISLHHIPIFQIPINPISSTFAWPPCLAPFQKPTSLKNCLS